MRLLAVVETYGIQANWKGVTFEASEQVLQVMQLTWNN